MERDARVDAVDEYTRTLVNHAPRTVRDYAFSLRHSLDVLRRAGRTDDPAEISASDVSYLISEGYGRTSVCTKHYNIVILDGFLKHHGNSAISDMGIVWPRNYRTKADWLDAEGARRVLDAVQTPAEDLVISLELCMGLRRVEVIRLRPCDIDLLHRKLDVRGKGRMGGKWRSIYIPDRVAEAIKGYAKVREAMISEARAKDPEVEIPAAFLIYSKYTERPRLGSYSEKGTGFDKRFIAPIVARSGVVFSNHTLRRTMGRCLWLSGAKPEVIGRIYGHEDPRVTVRYLGISIDDQREALRGLDFGEGRRCPPLSRSSPETAWGPNTGTGHNPIPIHPSAPRPLFQT